MNHSQFLTYGLLKLILKEVLNHQIDENNTLLCSYHMKTPVFLAIQQNTLHHWCSQNLLASFWVCFKLLHKWINKGTLNGYMKGPVLTFSSHKITCFWQGSKVQHKNDCSDNYMNCTRNACLSITEFLYQIQYHWCPVQSKIWFGWNFFLYNISK